ncbi:hypothetical protein B0H14DRAFT_3879701 [Mycena olivaceomarginata]|nr:hypothetical protein B0H14DRAFT_3879701 [Mycena olivaceomarginata]
MGHTTASHRKTSHRRRARPSGRRPTLPRVSTRCHPLASGTLRPRTSVSCRMRWRPRSCSRAAATSTGTARCRRPHRRVRGAVTRTRTWANAWTWPGAGPWTRAACATPIA